MMAVKQNNSEESNGTVGSESAASATTKPSNSTNTKASASAPAIPSNIKENVEESASTSNNNHTLTSQQQFNEQQPSIDIQNVNQNTNGENLHLLIGYFYSLAHDEDVCSRQSSDKNLVQVSNKVLANLANCPLPTNAQNIKSFKEDIQKVGEIFAKAAEGNHYLYLTYLQQVSKIIESRSPPNEPSGTIAIIFEIFPDDLIPKAVSMVLSGNDNASDDTITRTVKLMSDWLRHCTFCTNLHIWILAILKELREQRKFTVLMDIVRDIIDPLFLSLIVPVLRPKVYPIVFQILTSIRDTPVIFHKVIKRAPNLVKQLKKEYDTHNVLEVKKTYQELIDLIAALMELFPVNNHLYTEMDELLNNCTVSPEYRLLLDHSIWSQDLIIETSSSNARVGLVNLGNTCYMNSVLQAMVMTRDFSRELLLSDCKTPLLQKVQQLFAQLIHSQRPELTPSTVLQATRPDGFVPGYQQDSSEFLGYLLETLHEQETGSYVRHKKLLESGEMKNLHDFNRDQPSSSSSLSSQKLNDVDLPSSDWNSTPGFGNRLGGVCKMETDSEDSTTSHSEMSLESLFATTSALPQSSSVTSTSVKSNTSIIPTPPTIIDKIFTGKLATTYKCLACGWQSKNIDSFRDFPLSFPEVKDFVPNYCVQDLLNYYCSPETLDGDNQYYCEQCKKLCDAIRYMNIVEAPKNLILTLKQFTYDQNNHIRAKLMHKVYHDENIKIKVYSTDSSTDTNNETEYAYVLYAAVVHSGFSMDSGHYYTYATDDTNYDTENALIDYNGSLTEWYKFNDNIVTACKITELHKLHPPNTPYVLFYRMQSKITNYDNGGGGSGVGCLQPIETPKTPTLDELPSFLRDIVIKDNASYNSEIKLNTNFKFSSTRNGSMRGGRGDGDEDDQPPPPNNCGNAFNIHTNNYII